VNICAAHALSIEIDQVAIGNAEMKIARNGRADSVTVLEGDAKVLLPLVAPVDVVLANNISSALLALLPIIRSSLADGGRAILSGILREERMEMLAALQATGWRVEREDHEDNWWSVAIAPR